jgi:predicted nuclease with TOPRIM domain
MTEEQLRDLFTFAYYEGYHRKVQEIHEQKVTSFDESFEKFKSKIINNTSLEEWEKDVKTNLKPLNDRWFELIKDYPNSERVGSIWIKTNDSEKYWYHNNYLSPEDVEDNPEYFKEIK